jgi:hypothetical protein
MSKAKIAGSGETYTIVEPTDETEVVTIRASTTGETYEVVDFTDERVREYVTTLSAGSTVRLELAPVGGTDSEERTITQVLPATMPSPAGAEYSIEDGGV